MPEIKRTFSGSKMNKDIDERLVPKQEYRDANNIEINTSENDDVGTVQTLMGNTVLTSKFPAGSYCVGSIASKKTDKIYWLVAGEKSTTNNVTTYKDYVAEYDIQNATFKYVVVDIYKVVITTGTIQGTSSNKFLYCPQVSSKTFNNTGIRLDMEVQAPNALATSNIYVTDIVFDTDKWKIYTSEGFTTASTDTVTFTADRVLNFQLDKGTGEPRMITGLNVLDGMLFWTDNHSEPKKINIERCILGTGGEQYLVGGSNAGYSSTTTTNTSDTFTGDTDNFHTRLVSTNDGVDLHVITTFDKKRAAWLEEEHITVLKKAPLTPPYLEMSSTDPDRNSNNVYSELLNFSFATTSGGVTSLLTPSEDVYSASTTPGGLTFNTDVEFKVGDVLILTNDSTADPVTFTEHEIRIRIEGVPSGTMPLAGVYNWSLLAISNTLGTGLQDWTVRLEQKPPLFEFKFPRFAYRYKYKDGEYSVFSPFSEVAFLPGDFNYAPKQGYNLGMVNNLRSLKITDFIVEDSSKGKDVTEVDILFKNEDSPNIYTVKTIKKSDDAWPSTAKGRGSYTIESELIHAALPENQLLRSWDNVPRKALAQEITANRLVYGNYLQNYNLIDDSNAEVIPKIEVSLESTLGSLAKFNAGVSGAVDSPATPSKSVKSLRTYQVGVVYRDYLGRETPVLAGEVGDSTVTVDKDQSVAFNKLKAKVISKPPSWAHSWKFFVKETSNEYYNLAMDRWYNAEDGNVWLSFPSAERNKIQEDTFLILKKLHNNNKAVIDNAKYKVIAIENEAPTFIKTNTKVIGKLESATNWVTSTTAGFPFIGYDSFVVQGATNFYEAFGTASGTGGLNNNILNALHSGYLYVRFKSSTVVGSYYNIASIKETSTGNIEIWIDGIFKEDMKFLAPLQTTGSIISNLDLELATKIPENKPEFDGKFFVKIYKDLVLKQKVLSKTASSQMKVVTAMSPYYVNYNNVVEQNSSQNSSLIKDLKLDGSKNTWWIYPPGSSTDAAVGAFSDGTVISATSNKAYRRAVRAWWKAFGANWFIDSAITANEEVDTTPGTGLGTYGATNAGHLGSGDQTDNSFINSGQHGVYNNGKNIVLSWSGLYLPGQTIGGDEFNHAPGSFGTGGTEQYNLGSADCHPDQEEIVNQLSIGTQFRFAADPDQWVYTIKAVSRIENLHNYDTNDQLGDKFHWAANKRLRYDLTVENENGNGIGIDGVGYNPIVADVSGNSAWTVADSDTNITIEFVEPFSEDDVQFTSDNPAIWETEPKEDVGLDIYYEATQAYPIDLNFKTNEQFVKYDSIANNESTVGTTNAWSGTIKVTSWSDQTVTLDTAQSATAGDVISFTAPDGGVTRLVVETTVSSSSTIDFENTPHEQTVTLPFANCYSFQNGVESNRIRDDYNAVFIRNGVKASTTLAEPYEEERRGSGLIHSGVYNSTSGLNELNQFVQAEPITKDINPRYGKIQKLFSRNTDLVTICEDKTFKILSDKDALYNADGSTQLLAKKGVLGQTTAYAGDYGTQNPESFAADNYRSYFADKARGSVLRLSMDGLTPISSAGMHDWFSDNLKINTTSTKKNSVPLALGTFDSKKSLYNLTIKQKSEAIKGVSYESPADTFYTISYSESSKGWVSFKSFVPESGLSINNDYFTFKDGELYKEHDNSTRNNFYGVQYTSDITTILNDNPGSVKSFNAINYEGSQAAISRSIATGNTTDAAGNNVSQADGLYYNMKDKDGWSVESLTTNKQSGSIDEFIEKEGKWFNHIKGAATTFTTSALENNTLAMDSTSHNLDQHEFSLQGLGIASNVSTDSLGNQKYTFTVENHATGSDGSTWDSTPD